MISFLLMKYMLSMYVIEKQKRPQIKISRTAGIKKALLNSMVFSQIVKNINENNVSIFNPLLGL